MDNEKLIVEGLSPMERAVLPRLKKDFVDGDKVAEETSMDKTTVLRAVRLLEGKGLVEVELRDERRVDLGVLGLNYLKRELPERVLLNSLVERGEVLIGELKNVTGLNDNEVKVGMGVLKKKMLVDVEKGKLKFIGDKSEATKKMAEELFLENLPMGLDDVKDLDTLCLENLKRRKDIVEVVEGKRMSVRLTGLGARASKMDLGEDLLEALTAKMLKGTSWKGKKFRRYDLNAPVPRVYGGKRHFVNQATDYAKSIWLEMGFKEMKGDIVQSGFWVFDALFTAQDHPVREMQDTFFLKDLKAGVDKKRVIDNEKILDGVKKAHEGGVDGSKGWQCVWNEEDAKKVLLRTHTTCLSAKKLMEIGRRKEFPAKYFALGKCFRNETVDWSHGFEFNQTEGIVVDGNANFRQLLGYLKQFFGKMGYEKLRWRPAYFAYTEPSLEIDVWHEGKGKWLELGGAGMFRPEVTIPMFGRHVPVLAWGPGFDRIIMDFFGIDDLREMYKNDLNKLREMKVWR
jgi:phenylalanyl-tRNA synthetase alpha chain